MWKHKTDIALTAAAFVPGVGSVAVAARVYRIARAAGGLSRVIMNSRRFGVASKRFGSTSFGNHQGTWNRVGSRLKIGWDKHNKSNVFRIDIGRKVYYNKKMQKYVVVSRVHINLLRVRHR